MLIHERTASTNRAMPPGPKFSMTPFYPIEMQKFLLATFTLHATVITFNNTVLNQHRTHHKSRAGSLVFSK